MTSVQKAHGPALIKKSYWIDGHSYGVWNGIRRYPEYLRIHEEWV